MRSRVRLLVQALGREVSRRSSRAIGAALTAIQGSVRSSPPKSKSGCSTYYSYY